MPVTRHFLGWDRPCLHSLADWLLTQYQEGKTWNMRDVVVVLPGGRPGRRLLELLALRARNSQLRLVPPRIITLGSLPELVLGTSGHLADPITIRLAWAEALSRMNPHDIEALLPSPPPAGEPIAWMSISSRISAIHAELAGAGITFSQVAQRHESSGRPTEATRWRVLDKAFEGYIQILEALGFVDPHERTAQSIREGKVEFNKDLVIVASDLTRVQSDLLRLLRSVHAVIFAPRELSEAFDDAGNINKTYWQTRDVIIPDEKLAIVSRPRDQAAVVIQALSNLDGQYAADQVSVGVCDDTLRTLIGRTLEFNGLPHRDAAGWALAGSAPCKLLQALADYLEHERFSDLANLLRHPDIEALVHPSDTESVEDWQTLLDRYYNDHFGGRLSGRWLGKPSMQAGLKAVHDCVQSLAAPLRANPQTIKQWAEPILELLHKVFVSATTHSNETVRALTELSVQLSAVYAIPSDLGGQVNASAAIRLLLGLIEPVRIEPEADGPAIEMVGWLELSLDDAPVLIVVGFNEGRVPESLNADPFLPEGLRVELGLRDNASRYARDAYLLSAIMASRPYVKLIAGRWTVEGEPMLPSRLLLADGEAVVARRIQSFCDDKRDETPIASTISAAEVSAFKPSPAPEKPMAAIQSLPVTAFRDYIACPYRFYLKHVLKLQRLNDTAEELDGGQFGGIIHEVLALFGVSEHTKSTDPDTIAAFLSRKLREITIQKFGDIWPVTLEVQLLHAQRRLEAFAKYQANRAQEGWEIQHTELDFKNSPVELDVDREPFLLVGRIDRVDYHPVRKVYAAIDYKTSDSKADPNKQHLQPDGKWVDLQLPLYRCLLKCRGVDVAEMGYIVLPRDPAQTGFVAAEWSEAELSEAIESAREVVRGIRMEKFEPTKELPPFDQFGDICGVGDLVSAIQAPEHEV